jgi:hypothetical protein
MPAAPMPAETKPGQKDMWIMATSICQAVIQRFVSWQHGELVALAREAANAARAAARVFDGARVDEARSALSPPPRPAAPEPEGDPGDPRNTGPDFDDDIPF